MFSHFMSQFKNDEQNAAEKKVETSILETQKPLSKRTAVFIEKKLGSNLLSHKRTLHYHRRNCISLLCSEWEQVVLQHYGRQAYRVKKLKNLKLIQLVVLLTPDAFRGCMVKTFRALVLASFTPHGASTSSLSTS